jgi:hypothetical protein
MAQVNLFQGPPSSPMPGYGWNYCKGNPASTAVMKNPLFTRKWRLFARGLQSVQTPPIFFLAGSFSEITRA